MELLEGRSCTAAASIVFIGKNRHGNWVACERSGVFGGLFLNRAQAFKYALFKNGHHPETIVDVSREIQLDIFADLQIANTRRDGLEVNQIAP